MRRQDKKQNIKRANILAESIYLKKKNEDYDYAAAELEIADREDFKKALEDEEEEKRKKAELEAERQKGIKDASNQ